MTYPGSSAIARELDDFWKDTQSLFQQWWYEADLDTKMMTGQQDYWNTFYNINYRNQKILMFNKILRIQNMISGYQIDNRLASIITAADNDPDEGLTAKQRTEVLSWCKRQDSTYHKISDSFAGSLTCGLNLLHIWMDFREDPENGDIKTMRIPFNAFVMDPYWEQKDLSDCDRIWTRKYMPTRQLLSIMPDLKGEIPSLGKGYASKDGKFQFLAQNWYMYQQEMFAVDEYWVRTYRETTKILDTKTGEVLDWKGDDDQFKLLMRYNPNIKKIKANVPTIKLHVLVNNHEVYEEMSPWGLDRHPFVPYLCYHFPEVQNYSYRYQGIVRNIRDSQIELNRRRNRLLDILDAQIQSGAAIKENALVNPEDAFFQGPGKILFFKNSANLGTDFVPFQAPPVAPGWQELIASIEKEIMDIVGPEELFAQNLDQKDMSGVLLQRKMGAGLIGLRNVFDNLNQSQICTSEIMMDLALKNFGLGKIENILGEKPSPLFNRIDLSKYMCTVEEAELTTTQRQFQFYQALQMKQIMPEVITNDYLLDRCSLQDKKTLIDRAKALQEQQQQMQQQAMQLQMQNQAVLNRSIDAKAENDFASAEERRTRAVSNIGLDREREAMAVNDRAKAALETAQAMNEIQHFNSDKFMEASRFVMEMLQMQQEIELNEPVTSSDEAAKETADIKQKNLATQSSMQ